MVGGTLVVTTEENPLVDMQDMTRKGSKHSTEGVINTQGKTGRKEQRTSKLSETKSTGKPFSLNTKAKSPSPSCVAVTAPHRGEERVIYLTWENTRPENIPAAAPAGGF